MPTPPMPNDVLQGVVDAYIAAGRNSRLTAEALGIPRGTVDSRLHRARERGLLERGYVDKAGGRLAPPAPDAEFDVPTLPDALPTADELVTRRKQQFAKLKAHEDFVKLVPIRVNVDGPIGVCFLGDPHVDDNGTNIALLERHMDVVNRTEGLFAVNSGDMNNNWVGRLARLYADQSTSAAEAWVLVEWMVRKVRWLYMIGGNHDVWSGAGDPLQWMTRQAGTLYKWHGVRVALQMPNGKVVRINSRHDFRGHSEYNPAHGPLKAAMRGWRDHILTAGDKHVAAYNVACDPASGLLSHILRVGTYKQYDGFAKANGFPHHNYTPAMVAIIDPRFEDHDPRLIHVVQDVEEAAEYLTWKRSRKAA